MNNTITFEVGAIMTATSRAARVAPTKGMAFDKAAGILIEGRPGDLSDNVIVRATDIEVTYLEKLTPLEIKGDETFFWRFPSSIVAGFLQSLPPNARVDFTQDGEVVHMKCGKVKAKVRLVHHGAESLGAIMFDEFDDEGLTEVKGMATKVTQVSWACDRQMIPFSGVHMTGEYLFATDKQKMVRVPCKLDLENPITAPLDAVSPILAKFDDVRVGASGGRFLVEVDEWTQISSTIFANEYPKIERAMVHEYPRTINLPRAEVREAVGRMLALLGRTERYPVVELTIDPTNELLGLTLEVDTLGQMEDEIGFQVVEGDADDEPIAIRFSPDYLIGALDHADADTVAFSYNHENINGPIRIADGKGYEVWVMPRRRVESGGGPE